MEESIQRKYQEVCIEVCFDIGANLFEMPEGPCPR